MILTRLTSFCILVLLLASCSVAPSKKKIQLRSGDYEMQFDIGPIQIPVRLWVGSDGNWMIHNWTETINLDSLVISDSSFHIEMPLFNTSLNGKILTDSTFEGLWTDHSRDSLYQIPFAAFRKSDTRLSFPQNNPIDSRLTYQVVFTPENPEESNNAIGEFIKLSDALVGTFLTESGDYRYLEGAHTGSSLHLSSFDGAHLFYFCGNIDENRLTDGKFYSGKHWSEEWFGELNRQAVLRDPDSLTFVKDKEIGFCFKVQDFNGDSVAFDSSAFAGHVSIIQIFGSWCPNCTDESVFLKSLYDKYHTAGLNIIPVAFERNSELGAAKAAVDKQFAQLDLQYKPYFGGPSGKGRASDVFSMLSNISSYPTMIIVDKEGVVRKIHTGFYGPGTGGYYEKHCAELTSFISSLLNENASTEFTSVQ